MNINSNEQKSSCIFKQECNSYHGKKYKLSGLNPY